MPRLPIKDEFQHLKISKQRKYQLRKQREHRCTDCGAPTSGSTRCLKHLVLARERQRTARGTTRRYRGTLSYRLEQEAESARKDLS